MYLVLKKYLGGYKYDEETSSSIDNSGSDGIVYDCMWREAAELIKQLPETRKADCPVKSQFELGRGTGAS